MSREIIAQDYYNTEDPVRLAQELLGTVLVSEIEGVLTSGIIVETEAYKAPEDLACHALGNRRTPRTETMFADPGAAYVYKCYGIHDLFNVVTAPEGFAHAILVRAIEPLEGIEQMEDRRQMKLAPQLVNGPGKLTQALGITTDLDGVYVYDAYSPIRIEQSSNKKAFEIVAGPRVGMSHHTKHCGYYPWRFRIKDNRWTSKPDVVKYGW